MEKILSIWEVGRIHDVEVYQESLCDYVKNSFFRMKTFIDLLASYDVYGIANIGFTGQVLIKSEMVKACKPMEFLRDHLGDFNLVRSRDYNTYREIQEDDVLAVLFRERNSDLSAHEGVPVESVLFEAKKVPSMNMKTMPDHKNIIRDTLEGHIAERFRLINGFMSLLANQQDYNVQRLGFLGQAVIEAECNKITSALGFLHDKLGGDILLYLAREDDRSKALKKDDVLGVEFVHYRAASEGSEAIIVNSKPSGKKDGRDEKKEVINLEVFLSGKKEQTN